MVDTTETTQLDVEDEQVSRMFDTWNRIVEEKGQMLPEEDRPLEGTFLFGNDIKNQRFARYPAERVLVEKHTKNPPVSDPNFTKKPDEGWIIIEITPDNPYSPLVGRHTSTVGRLGALDYSEPSTEKKTIDYYTQALIVGISDRGRSFQSHDWREIETPATSQVGRSSYPYIKKQPGRSSEVYLPEEPEKRIETIEPLSSPTFERITFLAAVVDAGRAHVDMFQP